MPSRALPCSGPGQPAAAALVLRSFYHRRVLKPLVEMTTLTDHLLRGQRDIQYRYAEEHSRSVTSAARCVATAMSCRSSDSQRRQFSGAEAWYRQIIEFAPDGMLVVDEGGTILIANPKAHQLFGYVHGAMLGLSPMTWCRRTSAPSMHRCAPSS